MFCFSFSIYFAVYFKMLLSYPVSVLSALSKCSAVKGPITTHIAEVACSAVLTTDYYTHIEAISDRANVIRLKKIINLDLTWWKPMALGISSRYTLTQRWHDLISLQRDMLPPQLRFKYLRIIYNSTNHKLQMKMVSSFRKPASFQFYTVVTFDITKCCALEWRRNTLYRLVQPVDLCVCSRWLFISRMMLIIY